MKGEWAPEEDAKLTEAVKKYGTHWVAAAAMVPGRTNMQCRRRWTHTLDTAGKIAGLWNGEEDTQLTEAVKNYGKSWVAIAAMIPGRTNRWVDLFEALGNFGKAFWGEAAVLVSSRLDPCLYDHSR
jgi:hypothetical protein